MSVTRMRVAGPAPYDVVVGHDLLAEIPAMLGPRAQRVAVVHDAGLADRAEAVAQHLDGRRVLRLPLPSGESAKELTVAARCWDALGEAGFTRSDAVVTVGGGATTDMGGFVAAAWLRGVPVVHVPTSLLAMVDAAVGGKTGLNTAAGKNLVGAFHEPAGVICDLDTLTTLPVAELVSGLAEVAKCGFIADPAILDLLERDPGGATAPGSPALRELVERAVAVKVGVVAEDLRETGGRDGHPGREALNYGHTLGHAVERATAYSVRHGEAVSIGMVFVAELARAAGRLDEATAARHARLLGGIGLPVTVSGLVPGGLGLDRLLETMRVDKKTRGSTLRFVVLDGPQRPRILSGPTEGDLRAAYAAVAG